ncbi:MAG: hypothetical protein LBT98_03370 [Puniceicoccales bacterium]|jgi:hypothetical protein|nr:hypothetical protein [Puniceicoccales bacterium]
MSWFSKNVRHFLSRLVGGATNAEKRQRRSLLEQREIATRELDARRNALMNLRRAISLGRWSLLATDSDDGLGGGTYGS